MAQHGLHLAVGQAAQFQELVVGSQAVAVDALDTSDLDAVCTLETALLIWPSTEKRARSVASLRSSWLSGRCSTDISLETIPLTSRFDPTPGEEMRPLAMVFLLRLPGVPFVASSNGSASCDFSA